MIELWYAILAFMLTTYIVLDGRNFGAGILHLIVAKTPAERRQVIAAIGPLLSWHEVWLIAFGGVLFVAFPRLLASAFSGYYLALFLILWCFVLRGIAFEVGGHLQDRMWQSWWDAVFGFANVLLAILFGAALGNLLRGVPLDSNGEFHMAFFTNFGVRGNVGILDWYTVSMGVVCLAILAAHGATYLTLRTEGPVHDRSARMARGLWAAAPILFIIISTETWIVSPQLIPALLGHPLAWLFVAVAAIGAGAVFTGLHGNLEGRTLLGSNLVIAGLLGAGAATLFPTFLYSTLKPENSLTAYTASASLKSLELGLLWWPPAFVLTFTYSWLAGRHDSGKLRLPPTPLGIIKIPKTGFRPSATSCPMQPLPASRHDTPSRG